MPVPSGTRLGVYIVEDPIGKGGMGEVYRARDSRLDRSVALKVLPELFTADPERLARFEREAKVLASLNHPNIAQVYGFEPPTADSPAAIAMELVDGPTLQEVSAGHAAESGAAGLPLERALAIARQIATALDAAHERTIIHRDLKPANIKVREDGTVKVLDFGLAKALAADGESAGSAVAESPTLTARATQLGVILGTAAYMAPEQARGRSVDRRADVWAFGAVLFEMLTGRRAFDGDDVSDVLASVLKSDPDWQALPADLPAPVQRLLRRCLEKDPKKRLRDIAEGMLQLDEGLAGDSGSTSAPSASLSRPTAPGSVPLWRRAVPILTTAVLTAVVAASIAMMRREPPAPRPAVARFQFSAGRPLMSALRIRDVAISPDGQTVAYSVMTGPGTPSIYTRRIDQLEGTPVTGTAGAAGPVFSPDGQWIGFQTNPDDVRKVSIAGGRATPIVKASNAVLGMTWTTSGIVLGLFNGPLQVVSEEGGPLTPLTALDEQAGETAHTSPVAVPGTNVIVFVIATGSPGTPTSSKLAAVDRSSGRTVRLNVEGSQPAYVSTGHIIYASAGGSLRAIRFNPQRMAVEGTSVGVLEGVGGKPSGAANYDISTNGTLVYTRLGADTSTRTLAWVERAGAETPIAAPARSYFYVRVSPDGTQLSLDVRDYEQDIWIWDIKRESMSRLTDRAAADQYGLWTPDRRLIFTSLDGVRSGLFVHRADGVGQPQAISEASASNAPPFPNAVTPDGTQLIYRMPKANGTNDLYVLNLNGTRTVKPLLTTPRDEKNAALSPDGRFMAFESDTAGGGLEVYVRPFPNVDEAQYKVSSDGGEEPLWSPDGREIFYRSGSSLISVPAKITAAGLELGRPQRLFDVSKYFFGGVGRNYDVAPDGKRFVMVKEDARTPQTDLPLYVVFNWVEELRARLKRP